MRHRMLLWNAAHKAHVSLISLLLAFVVANAKESINYEILSVKNKLAGVGPNVHHDISDNGSNDEINSLVQNISIILFITFLLLYFSQ